MITRKISPLLQKSRKSILLLGPRQVGKSTLIHSLRPDLTVQLADEMEFYTFSSNPGELRTRIESENPRTVSIDEVQRLPGLLNTTQAIVDSNPQMKFYLTGSSARKLKRGGSNLLPGRVLNFHLGPLVSAELDGQINTRRALAYGTLPGIYLEKNQVTTEHLLRSYVSNYIKEEIKAEALVRNLEAFTRFTQVALQSVGQFIDYSKLAKRAKVSRHSLDRFFEIFEDTLIGHRIWPYEKALKVADVVKHPKFYLFDNGVLNASLGSFALSADRVGLLAEQLVFSQILHSSWAALKETKISTFRTRGGLEVDFVVEIERDVFALEVKSFNDVNQQDVASLVQFKKNFPFCRGLLVLHMGSVSKKYGSVWSLPWQKGIKEMGL